MSNPEKKDTDRHICSLIQSAARMPLSTIAEQIGLSNPSISEHLRKMEEAGTIEGYYTKLNPRSFGYDITAYVFVDIESSVYYQEFIRVCKTLAEILECHAITGNASHMLKIRTQNTGSLEALLSKLQQIPGVKRTITNLVLSTHIETFALPISEARKKQEAR